MKIQTRRNQAKYVLELDGRLDASWSAYVDANIEAAIQGGHHEIDIDLAKVDYMSSAGIGVLLKYRKKLIGVQGCLRVIHPTENVLSVLRLMRLSGLLMGDSGEVIPRTPTQQSVGFEHQGSQFEVYQLESRTPLKCDFLGKPELFPRGLMESSSEFRVPFDSTTFGLGLGAFSDSEAEGGLKKLGRFGESLGVAGVVVQHAADDSRVPDYQLRHEDLVPELRVLYGIFCKGDFSHLVRFEAAESSKGTIGYSEFVSKVCDQLDCPNIAFAVIAECASVVGARMLRFPEPTDGQSPWEFPGIRDWLTFTSEQGENRKLALVVGVVCRNPPETAKAFLRPLGEDSDFCGHAHAAEFSYRPLPKGVLDLTSTVRSLFEKDTPRSVLHLMMDSRPIEGVGETEFMRGACWCGPIKDWTSTTGLERTEE